MVTIVFTTGSSLPKQQTAKITWLLTNWRNQRKRSSEQREPEWVRLLWRQGSDTSGSSPGATFPHFESWSFVSSKRAERIPSFFSSSTRSPFWCICRRMSQPPHELATEVHLRDGRPAGVVFNAAWDRAAIWWFCSELGREGDGLPELGVVQHAAGRVVADAMQPQDLHHRAAEAALGLLRRPLKKTSTLSSFTNASRCSDEPLPPESAARMPPPPPGPGTCSSRHAGQSPRPPA